MVHVLYHLWGNWSLCSVCRYYYTRSSVPEIRRGLSLGAILSAEVELGWLILTIPLSLAGRLAERLAERHDDSWQNQ